MNSDSPVRSQKPKTHRQLMFVMFGLFLFSAAGFFIFDHRQVHTTITPTPPAYKYTVQQSETNEVHYRQNSFFGNSSDPTNSAYISALTDNIYARFHYTFQANEATDLSYQYGATAVVKGTYGSKESTDGLSNVWSKQFQVLKPVSGKQNSKSLNLDQVIQIPYAKYKSTIDQFKSALNVPVNSEMDVTYNVQVSGSIYGKTFKDNEVSTITAPLDQQVYRLAVNYNKSDQHNVAPSQSQWLDNAITRYEMPVAIALIVLGLANIIYGFRRQIIKTPYQRKLQRIYRFQDGIIIHAKRLTAMEAKNIVTVDSFDDLLNLEEEIMKPIIAYEVSDTTTHFLITQDDIVYVYTLGEPVPFSPSATAVETHRPKTKRTAVKLKVLD